MYLDQISPQLTPRCKHILLENINDGNDSMKLYNALYTVCED